MGMAGATVLRGPYGFGRSGHLRSELNVDAGSLLPVVVEIVDSPENIERFLPCYRENDGKQYYHCGEGSSNLLPTCQRLSTKHPFANIDTLADHCRRGGILVSIFAVLGNLP